jgi:hypothetical protein
MLESSDPKFKIIVTNMLKDLMEKNGENARSDISRKLERI